MNPSTCDLCKATELNPPEWKTIEEVEEDVHVYDYYVYAPVLDRMVDNDWDILCDVCINKVLEEEE